MPEIIESGTREDIFDHPMHPHTIGLFAALPRCQKELNGFIRLETSSRSIRFAEGMQFKPDACAWQNSGCENIPLVEITPGHFSCAAAE